MALLGYLPKLKRDLDKILVKIFSMIFGKNVSYSIIYHLTKFQCHTFFPSQDIKQNMLLSSFSDNRRRHKL